jgi:hypothetical protein
VPSASTCYPTRSFSLRVATASAPHVRNERWSDRVSVHCVKLRLAAAERSSRCHFFNVLCCLHPNSRRRTESTTWRLHRNGRSQHPTQEPRRRSVQCRYIVHTTLGVVVVGLHRRPPHCRAPSPPSRHRLSIRWRCRHLSGQLTRWGHCHRGDFRGPPRPTCKRVIRRLSTSSQALVNGNGASRLSTPTTLAPLYRPLL